MSKVSWIIVIASIVVVFAGSYLFFRYANANKPKSAERYAVFLTNDQVYFGYLKDENDNYVILDDIYYLKSNAATGEQGKVSLVKWGEEIHGPENEMFISRDQVLYMAKMKSESKINEAIKKFQEKGPVIEQTQPQAETAPAQ